MICQKCEAQPLLHSNIETMEIISECSLAEGRQITIYRTKHDVVEYRCTQMDNSSLGDNTRN